MKTAMFYYMSITPRKLSFPFGPEIPRHWLMGNPFATHFVNGLNLVFPAGERFFMRSVKHYAHVVAGDPVLEAEVRAFLAQEAIHGREHDRFIRVLEEDGFDLTRFMAFYEWTLRRVLERGSPPKLNLAVTVALEHFTATLAELVLNRKTLLEDSHPVMRDLLLWHAAEEIEHKAVAFDVLKKVDPNYALRVTGLLFASASLLTFWWLGAATLFIQDRDASVGRAARDVTASLVGGPLRDMTRSFVGAFADYLRPGFHPSDRKNLSLAETYLKEMAQSAAV